MSGTQIAETDREGAADEAGGYVEFVYVRIGDERYALEAGRVRQLVRDPSLSRVPRTPSTIAGVTGVDGEPTAAIEGRAIAGVDDSASGERSPVLVVFARTERAQTTGLLVDAVERLATHAVEEIAAPDEGRGVDADRRWLKAVLAGEDETGVLDPERVIEAARTG